MSATTSTTTGLLQRPAAHIAAAALFLAVSGCEGRPRRQQYEPLFVSETGRETPAPAQVPLAEDLPGYDGPTNPGSQWVNELGMEFVYIPAGEFRMGGPSAEELAEMPAWHHRAYAAPVHRVRLTRPFLMLQTEVTRQNWKAVMEGATEFKRSDTLPKDGIVWREAAEFCRSLSEHTGRTYRLPTEAEWEYACRAGTTTSYHWGDDFGGGTCNAANHRKQGGPGSNFEAIRAMGLLEYQPTPVKSFPPNAWGLYDMHGNVEEWCADAYGELSTASATDPTGPRARGQVGRVVRGGTFGSSARMCTAFVRRGNNVVSRGTSPFEPENYVDTSPIGFRVVIDSLEPRSGQDR
jgi:formylglycine-generating enzyme required for sulfatase activity